MGISADKTHRKARSPGKLLDIRRTAGLRNSFQARDKSEGLQRPGSAAL